MKFIWNNVFHNATVLKHFLKGNLQFALGILRKSSIYIYEGKKVISFWVFKKFLIEKNFKLKV